MHEDESTVGKFIVFKIADYLLALPIGDVLKVINCSAVADQGLKTMGVVQIGQHLIRVLNLHQQLSPGSSPQLQRFLVITRTPQGELCGFPVDEPPNLMELAPEMLQSLPPSSNQSGVLAMVSQAAVISQGKVTTTIFLLDLKRAASQFISVG